ncbi:MAG: NAD(P)-dependent oxidoreductase [Acetobacteraceae bacterium]|nr:NAD(P)-dependent oxidoreductase [Acetobacteraceae bacterium]
MIAAPARILITGASGFVGRHPVTTLARAYPNATVLASWFDVRNTDAVDTAVRASAPDACIHLAAIASVPAARQDETQAWQVNLLGSIHLARAILRHVPKCQMLFASSSEVYGESFRTGTPLDETAALAPTNVYSATKAAAEAAWSPPRTGCARCGPGIQPHRHQPVGRLRRGRVRPPDRTRRHRPAGPVMAVGNIDTWRDFLDVRDVCAAYVACLDRRETLEPGTIFNLASGTPRRIGDILATLLELAGVTVDVQVDQSRVRTTDLRTASDDAARAAARLGWTSTVGWTQTLQDVLDDWRRRVAAAPDAA